MIKSKRELETNIAEYQSVSLKPMVLVTLRGSFDDITHAPYGMDQLLWKVPVHPVSEPAYQDIDNIGLGVEMVVPNMFQDHGFGNNPVGVSHQVFEQGKLTRLKIDVLAGTNDFSLEKIDRQVPNYQTRGFRGPCGPADQCSCTRDASSSSISSDRASPSAANTGTISSVPERRSGRPN